MSYLRDQWDVVNHARAAGTKGVLALLKFGEEKPSVLGELEPIASDVFKGLLAGLSSEIQTNRV